MPQQNRKVKPQHSLHKG